MNNVEYPDGIRLFVIGDSFSVAPRAHDPAMVWTRVAAKQLAEHHQAPVTLVNSSLMGVSQDYCWMILHSWIDSGALTENDYLIVAMTHPGRFWYLDREPELSNANIIDLDRHCTKEESKAIEMFIKHIQRPRLDAINLINRMGWLGYQKLKLNLRKPLLIKGFEQDLYQYESMDDIMIANGSLFEDIQYWEFDDPTSEENNGYFDGIDCRYNHMCLSNHAILGTRVADALYHGTELDLSTGYIRGILKADSLEDEEFCRTELDVNALEFRKANLKKEYYNPVLPWKRKVKIPSMDGEIKSSRKI
jgi:hypothetical protein